MRKYEIMYILNASLEEEARQQLIDTLHAIITDEGGSIDKIDEWGIKEFAYEINHMSKGYYMVVTFQADVETVKELDRICRINQNVVRHLIVNLEEQ